MLFCLFQTEDGIRDYKVTGVQTCALPIYGAKEWREGSGDDEAAFRTERIERKICRGVAEFAFQTAERTGAKVFGRSEESREGKEREERNGRRMGRRMMKG